MEKLIRREYSGLELAIVGIECKFPGSNNLDEFWKNICEGKELISFFTQEELLAEEVSERMSMYENYVKASGYISGKECFDSNFFGYTSTEARLMNPQMRMLHEGVWNALEDSGYDPSKYEGKIGLFAGAAKNYVNEISGIIKDKETNQKGVMSRHLYNVNFMCSRIAYNLNLQGPAVFVDTACSSSLVSVHLASNSILLGECDIAIAGGIRLFENSKSGYLYEPGGINSDDGHCRAFDEKANGTIPGEGMGLVVIKKLKNAIEDGDNIYAIIKGTAINNDGKGKVGYTAPSIHGQIDIIRKSLKRAKVVPNTIKYIEGHGTGTTLGDSIELQALNQIFKNNIEDKILLGSVKTNIGHLDFAAGIAGLIKTALVVKNKKVPPTVHFNKLNPNVLESTFPLMVNSELITIKSNNAPVRAGVSAFGIGGTNAHIVLEEPPILKHTVDEDENRLLLLSAHSSQALENRRNDILDFLKANNKVSFKDLIYTLQSGRKSLKYRTGYVCKNVQEAIGALSDSIEINKETIKLTNECKQIVFMFSGQGSQYVNMGAELYSEVDYIRELMDKCFDIASTYLDYDIKDILFTEGHDDRDLDEVNNTNNTQPLLFIIEYSLGCWLMELGIKPNFMIGHSLGEYVASCLSGAIDLEDALRLVIMRGKLIWSMPRGSMLSVSLSEDEVMQYLSENVDLAAVNANNLCVLSGKTEAIDSLEIILKQEEVVCKKLVTSHAFHSKMLTPILKDFENEVLKTKFDDIKIPIVSNLTGEFLKQSEISNPKYWSNHLRKTVRFNQGIQKLLKNPNTLFIEIGPGKTLASLLQYNLVGNEQFNKIVTSIRPGNVEENDHRYLLKSLFNIWNAGIELRWEKTFKNSVKRLALPGYPFDNIKYLPYNQNEYVNDHMPNNSINSRINIEEWFYESSWKMKSLFMGNDFDENEKSKKICLVFIEKLDFVEIFLGKLKEQGCNIILVEKGEGFKEYSKKKYEINPYQTNEYKRLFEDIEKNNEPISEVIYLWGLNEKIEDSYLNNPNALTKGIGCILNILKEVNKNKILNESKFVTFSNKAFRITGAEKINPLLSAQVALLMVYRQENPFKMAFNIDISIDDLNIENTVDKLLNEINFNSEVNVCYRNGIRWVPDFLKRIVPEVYKDVDSFKNEGIYIIIGGLGNLGMEISRYLKENFNAKLILLGRSDFNQSDFSNDKNKNIYDFYKEFVKQNEDVSYYSCDASNSNELLKIGEFTIEKYGNIDGVIHLGGIGGGRNAKTALELTKSDFDAQYKAKVHGLISINQLLDKYNVELCVLSSSLSSVLGGLGFGAYASANSVMDQFVDYLQTINSKTSFVNINFDGINFSQIVNEETHRMIAVNELPILLNYALMINKRSGMKRFVISTTELSGRIDKWVNSLEKTDKTVDDSMELQNLIDRPVLSTNYIEATSETQKQLEEIWKEVLGISEIGINDDFNDLGGDSLKAMTLIGKIHKQFDAAIPLKVFLKSPTVDSLSKYIDQNEKNEFKEIPFAEKKEYYQQSEVQRRMFAEQQLNPGSTLYNIPKLIKLQPDITKEQVEKILNILIQRHECLRTKFDVFEGGAIQRIMDNYNLLVKEEIIKKENLEELVNNFIKPFDLTKSPLLRAKYLKTEKEVYLLTDIHHIIFDWISQNLLQEEFFLVQKGEKLSQINYTYKDYSEWQNSRFYMQSMKEQQVYWEKRFAGELSNLKLPQDNYHKNETVESIRKTFWLSERAIANLKNICKSYELTLHSTCVGMLGVFLAKICSQSDIVIGTVVNGRKNGQLDKVFGMFVNTLAIRLRVDSQVQVSDYFKQIQNEISNDFVNQEFQFGDLIDKVIKRRLPKDSHLIRVMFNLMTSSVNPSEIKNKKVPNNYIKDKAKFDLLFRAIDYGDEMSIDFIYRAYLFNDDTIDLFLEYLNQIFENFGENDQLLLEEFILREDLSKVEGIICDTDFEF